MNEAHGFRIGDIIRIKNDEHDLYRVIGFESRRVLDEDYPDPDEYWIDVSFADKDEYYDGFPYTMVELVQRPSTIDVTLDEELFTL